MLTRGPCSGRQCPSDVVRVNPQRYCRRTTDTELTSHRLNSRQFIRDGSGPNVVCINNEPKAIPCALSSNNSSEECGPSGSEQDRTADSGTDIVVSGFPP